jgi:hypothetical protein
MYLREIYYNHLMGKLLHEEGLVNYASYRNLKINETTERQDEIHRRSGMMKARQAGLQGSYNAGEIAPGRHDAAIASLMAYPGGGESTELESPDSISAMPGSSGRDQSADIFTRNAVIALMTAAQENRDELSTEDATRMALGLLAQHRANPELYTEFLPKEGETLPPANSSGWGSHLARLQYAKQNNRGR